MDTNSTDRPDENEYPDTAGYPDGRGFLDEGTAVDDTNRAIPELDTPSSESDGDIAVVDDREGQLWRATVEGEDVAVMHYARDSTVVTIRSTVVEASARGRGIATDLIAHVLDELRDAGETVIIECPEVRKFVTQHPEYADLEHR